MQSKTRNRKLVAMEVTKYCENGKRSAEPFLKHRYSRMLYNKQRELFLSAVNREVSPASFQHVKTPRGTWVWTPMNEAAETLLKTMSPEECYAFVTHPAPKAKPMECESKAILNGSRIKGTPRGTTEAELFPEPKPPRRINSPVKRSETITTLSEKDEAALSILMSRISGRNI